MTTTFNRWRVHVIATAVQQTCMRWPVPDASHQSSVRIQLDVQSTPSMNARDKLHNTTVESRGRQENCYIVQYI